jgi:NAD(P)-dependent dehydrogenase (short-subunit alcohol dehydrogenase family)
MAEGQKEVTDRLAARISQRRLGESEEIAPTVALLLSDLSSCTTGTGTGTGTGTDTDTDFVVDGAFLLRE